jgi:hypothetical protein
MKMRNKMKMNTLLSSYPLIRSSLHVHHRMATNKQYLFKPKTENEIELADAPIAVVSFGRCPRIATPRWKNASFRRNQREIPAFSCFISGLR